VLNVVITLVYSVVLLFFMIYPAMKITEIVYKKFPFPHKYYNFVTILITVFLSLTVGVFLKFI